MAPQRNGIILGLLVLVLFLGFVWFQSSITPAATPTSVAEQPASDLGTDVISAVPSDKTLTMLEVATHNSESSCWSVIDNHIYDLTRWIPQHPSGGQAILGLCGKDGTNAFHGQHGEAKRQADILASMKIGELSK